MYVCNRGGLRRVRKRGEGVFISAGEGEEGEVVVVEKNWLVDWSYAWLLAVCGCVCVCTRTGRKKGRRWMDGWMDGWID